MSPPSPPGFAPIDPYNQAVDRIRLNYLMNVFWSAVGSVRAVCFIRSFYQTNTMFYAMCTVYTTHIGAEQNVQLTSIKLSDTDNYCMCFSSKLIAVFRLPAEIVLVYHVCLCSNVWLKCYHLHTYSFIHSFIIYYANQPHTNIQWSTVVQWTISTGWAS